MSWECVNEDHDWTAIVDEYGEEWFQCLSCGKKRTELPDYTSWCEYCNPDDYPMCDKCNGA